MNQKILFEIKKFTGSPVFFTDRSKILNIGKVIKTLPKNTIIIIREYDLDTNSREIFAKKIISVARDQALKTLVGKDFSLARKIKADGVHFSDLDTLPLQFFRKKSFPKKFIFSFSCHDEKSFLKWRKLSPNLLFISPIFPTTSHVNAKVFGLKNLAKFVAKNMNSDASPSPIYALGGINSANLQSIRKLGITGFGAINFFKNL